MTDLSYVAEQVRRHDHDRFLTAIFAPEACREDLFALYAFNIEIAKTGEVVSEPLIGLMRLQWWRDALDRLGGGGDIAHEVARPLARAIRGHGLSRALFDRLIAAREIDLDRAPPADMPAMLDYAEATGAPLLELALRIAAPSGVDMTGIPRAARLIGTAWALTGLLRAVPFHARQRRVYLPADRLAAAGVGLGALFDGRPGPGLAEMVHGIAEDAAALLLEARRNWGGVPPRSRSPLLLAVLANVYLADLRRAGWDPFVLEQRPGHPLMTLRLAFHRLAGRP